VSSTASRLHPAFGDVLAIGSDLESETRQLTLGFIAVTQRGAVFRLWYTLTGARDQSSYSCCSVARGFGAPTTAGDPNAPEWATSDLERRHAFLATVNYPLTTGLELSAIGRLTSGIPYTPRVGDDINGDGARNDRAFVFDPATASDSGLARGMRALFATAPGGARGCLERQLGRIAERNSCRGPWQPALDLQVNWRPGWFGPGRPLTLSLLTVNLLGGLDGWLHGAEHLRGWGYAAPPDPVLLKVRAFDPTTPRFLYGVNGRFGAPVSTRISAPFQLALQAHLALGSGPARAPVPSAPAELLAPALASLTNPVREILQLGDSLELSPAQRSELGLLADSLEAENRAVSEGARREAERAGESSDPVPLVARLEPTVRLQRERIRRALERAEALLTTAQCAKLPPPLKACGTPAERAP
jgi:hypothetical protein